MVLSAVDVMLVAENAVGEEHSQSMVDDVGGKIAIHTRC